jgi:hypothetical protein
MSYKALTFVELGGRKFSPGETIDQTDLIGAAEQSEENIAALIKDGVISEDMDAPVDEAHVPPEGDEGVISTSDGGSGN